MLRFTEPPEQNVEAPFAVATGAAGAGLTVTVKLDALPFPHALVAAAEIVPETALEEKLTVIEFVLVPPVITAPEGKVQL